jgi:hypothetical protein
MNKFLTKCYIFPNARIRNLLGNDLNAKVCIESVVLWFCFHPHVNSGLKIVAVMCQGAMNFDTETGVAL